MNLSMRTLVAAGGAWLVAGAYVCASGQTFAGANSEGKRRKDRLKNCVLALVGGLFLAAAVPAARAQTATSLAVTSSGGVVTTVSSGSVVTLTATVTADSLPVKAGQVNFCDATAAYCTDIHLLATAQLTTAGTATYKFRPGIGTHHYKAVFTGTTHYAVSTSGTAILSVTGLHSTTTTIAASGGSGNYTLTADVGTAGAIAPTGLVSFLDTTNSNAVLGTASLGPAAGPSLVTSSTPTAGEDPESVAVGDFNGDGIPDMAVANVFGNTVTILLGNGDGTFTAVAEQPATDTEPSAIVAADLNGDGVLDLAVATQSGLVTVLIGKGDGTFTRAASQVAGDDPLAIAVGDFNRDGNLDLAVANNDPPSNTVTILLGDGQGGFTHAASSPVTGSRPRSIAAADFNRDGILDLAVLNGSGDTVTMLLGKGDGTFTAITTGPLPNTAPITITTADFNRDGIPDLAIADQVSGVTVMLGKGDGTFIAPGSVVTEQPTPGIAVADFNGDGIPDLAIGKNNEDHSVMMLLGKGDGTFETAASTAITNLYPISFAVGDFNGDGIQDLAVANSIGESVEKVAALLTLQSASTPPVQISLPFFSGTHKVEASYPGDSSHAASAATVGLTAPTGPAATMTSPTPGASLTGPKVTFTWTAVTSANSYQVEIGTTAGGSDLDNSGTLTATSYTPANLPTNGHTIHVRLITTYGSHQIWNDYTYTAATQAALTSPTPNSVLVGPRVTFTWTLGTSATAFIITMGTTVGASDLDNSGTITASSYTPTYLPDNGETVYTRLTTVYGSSQAYTDYTFTAATGAVISSPTPGSVLSGPTVTFTWTAAANATGYILRLGSTVGGSDLYLSGTITGTSCTPANLPINGSSVFAQLVTVYGTSQAYVNYTYAALAVTPPAVTTPTPGSTLNGSSVTFRWNPAAPSTSYAMKVSTLHFGGSDVFAGTTSATSMPVSGIPTNGAKLYVQLEYKVSGTWIPINYAFTEAGAPTPPAMITPTAGSTLTGSSATFQWSPGNGPTSYILKLGTTHPGASNVYILTTTATSVFVGSIPADGSTLYVQLEYELNGTWYALDYIYTEAGSATPPAMITPPPGSKLTGSTVTFQWSRGAGTEYSLKLGTTHPGASDVYTGTTTSNAVTVSGIPKYGATLYVTLEYKVGVTWTAINYSYFEAGFPIPPAMISPAPGSTLTGSTVTFTWNAGGGPTEYRLRVGTGVGTWDVYLGNPTTSLSAVVSNLPTNGKPLYVTLGYKVADEWHAVGYTYKAQ